MEEGKGERYLASGRQYGNALLGVCHQEEEEGCPFYCPTNNALKGDPPA